MPRRNILIFHSGALGDFILTWPLALALARLHAQSRIFYITSSSKGALSDKLLNLESRDIDSGFQHLFSSPENLPPPALSLLQNSHLILNFLTDASHPLTTHLRTLSQTEVLPLSPRATTYLTDLPPILQTATTQLIRSLNDHGLKAHGPRSVGSPTLLHPGAGSPEKCWPLENWIQLATHLQSKGHSVRFLLGEVEHARLDIPSLQKIAPTISPDSYLSLANHLSSARLFIGHDTGPTHLSSILGTPTLSLYGPTNPTIWKPLGPQTQILHHHPLQSLTLPQVLDFLTKAHGFLPWASPQIP